MADVEGLEHRSSYREVLVNPAFNALFTARSLGVSGDALRALALSVLVFGITRSALLAALAYSISFIPQVLGNMALGALADRLRPRPVLACAYALDGATGLAIGLGRPPVWVSLTLVAAVAIITPVAQGAGSRVVADVLDGEDYIKGRALWCIAPLFAQLAGLALAGLSLATVGARGAILVSVGFHAAASVMIRLRLPNLPHAQPAAAGAATRKWWSTLSDSSRGVVWLMRTPSVRTLMFAQWALPGLLAGAEALFVPYAAARGYPSYVSGIWLACLLAGVIIGNVFVGRTTASLRERLTAPLAVMAGLPLLPLAFNPPLLVVAGLLVLSGFGLSFDLGLQRRFLDVLPTDGRGQAFALLGTGLLTSQGVAPVLSGWLAQAVPTGAVMTLTGGLAAGAGGYLIWKATAIKRGQDPAQRIGQSEVSNVAS